MSNTERVRKWRENHKDKYAYYNLKHNAKRRGKVFKLSFEDFKTFCVKYDYIGKKGIKSENLSIDRKNNNLGYTSKNIQPMEFGKNSSKGTKKLWYNMETGEAIVTKIRKS